MEIQTQSETPTCSCNIPEILKHASIIRNKQSHSAYLAYCEYLAC